MGKPEPRIVESFQIPRLAEDCARFFRKMKQLTSLELGNADCLDLSDTFILELPLEKIQELILRYNFMTAFDDQLPMISVFSDEKKLYYLCGPSNRFLVQYN